MANSNYLSPFTLDLVKKAKLKIKLTIWLVISIISFITSFFLYNNILISLFIFIFVSFLIREFYFSKKIDGKFVSGYEGEKNALKILKNLPKSFTIFNQIEVPSNESSFNEFETDFIIVGTNSIFIIEVKKFHGKIICGGLNEDWIKQVFYPDGKLKFNEPIKSPFRQVSKQKRILYGYLKKFDIRLDIKTIVFLNMNKKDYTLPKNEDIPVFSDKSINKYIKKVDQNFSSYINGYHKEELINILVNQNENSKNSRRLRLKDRQFLNEYFV